MGVAGSGKSTVGEALADRLDAPFLDADELHTPACVERMRRGEPLTDRERTEWIERVSAALRARDPLVVACSALLRAHRDRLRAAGDVQMVLLEASPRELERRISERRDHFFPSELLRDQLATLEPPAADEGVLVVDGSRPPAALVHAIATKLTVHGHESG